MTRKAFLAALLVGTLASVLGGAEPGVPPPAKSAFAGIAWTGAANTDWHTAGNWSGGAVPGATDDVLIDAVAGTNQPTINLAGGAVTIKSLTIGSTTNATLTFMNGNVTGQKLRVDGNVTIGVNGTLTHSAEPKTSPPWTETHRLFLDVGGNLTINGTINVAGKGYAFLGTGKPFNGYGPGGSGENDGGGHGGEGGRNTTAGATYDSMINPTNSGSGGIHGVGGGVVKLVVKGDLILKGSVLADGTGSGNNGAAGGSVNIVAAKLAGAGTISANGGAGASRAGGGGGRVAITLTNAADSAFAALSSIRAHGGAGGASARAGGAGTVYLKGTNNVYGRLIVDNNNVSADTTSHTLVQGETLLVDRIEVRNGGRLALGAGCILDLSQGCVLTSDRTSRFIVDSSGNPTIRWPASYTIGGAATPCTLSWKGTSEYAINCANLTIATNGVLTHEPLSPSSGEPVSDGGPWAASTVSFSYDQRLCAKIQGSLTVQPGGKIDVAGCGYKGGPSPGINNSRGGSHGGQGGGSWDLAYGSVTDPTLSGSGGYIAWGGGAVKLTITGGFALNGAITADGRSAHEGAAGGSVNITAGTLTGDGIISANGGNGGDRGGGGGRVALVLTNAADTAFDRLTITAYG